MTRARVYVYGGEMSSIGQELSVIRAREFGDAKNRLCAKNGKSENLGMNNPRLFALREGVIMGMHAGCGIQKNEVADGLDARFRRPC